MHRPARNVLAAIRAPMLRGDARMCPICEGAFRAFLRSSGRPDAICPRCYSAERHRLLWVYLRDHTDFFSTPRRVLHIAPENCMETRLRAIDNLDYVTADLEAPADVQLDLTNSSLESESFDVIICMHVLEHIPDDAAAMSELRRMIRPTGLVVIDVPLDARQETFEPATATPAERYRLLGQHDHVRFYGRADLRDRLLAAGFSVSVETLADLTPDDRRRLAVHDQTIHLCRPARKLAARSELIA